MKGMLAPKFKEVVLGYAEVRQVFKASGVGTIGRFLRQRGQNREKCKRAAAA